VVRASEHLASVLRCEHPPTMAVLLKPTSRELTAVAPYRWVSADWSNMTEIAVGDVVRITVVGEDRERASTFLTLMTSDPEISGVLTPMPTRGESEQGDFGLVELAQEFVVAVSGGATTAGLIAAVKNIWQRGHQSGDLSAAPPTQQAITESATSEGVTEITIRIKK
jgi:hypothetical protein